jgi:hypothetical protein
LHAQQQNPTEILPAAAEVHVRLQTPLASYMKPGTPFSAKVIDLGVASTLPPDSTVAGVIRQATSIGVGIKHERAALELAFTACTLPDGQSAPCDAILSAVENARENVTRTGRIQGILSASHPHSWLGGVWYRPGSAISGRSASGLTGAGGKLQSVLAPSPIGAAAAVVSRLILFRLPDSEIELPAGTDLVLRVYAAAAPPDTQAPDEPRLQLPPALRLFLKSVPAEVTSPDGEPADDIVNLAFFCTREQLENAFRSAGWNTADPLTAKTFARSYAAVSAMRAYPTAPVSPLLYGSRLPDAVFQKSLNSLSKRHHIRLWNVETPSGPVWLGAATHDIAAAVDWGRMTLTHKIDPNIDIERQKVIYDLHEAGCLLESSIALERAALARPLQTADALADAATLNTDGALRVARLGRCSTDLSARKPIKRPKRPFTTAIARRFVLETRHYLTRGNAYYWTYRGVRWSFSAKSSATASSKRSSVAASGQM